MWIFNRHPPPPPPKIPQWASISVPIIMAVLIGLVALVYNTMAADLEEVKGHVEKVEEKKVDNTTLQILLENQKLMIQQQKEESEHQREVDAKKFEELQKTQTKTLERIEEMQVQKQAPQIIVPPSAFRIKAKTKPTLNTEQFEKIIAMDPEVRVRYLKYLRHKGYDTEGLE